MKEKERVGESDTLTQETLSLSFSVSRASRVACESGTRASEADTEGKREDRRQRGGGEREGARERRDRDRERDRGRD